MRLEWNKTWVALVGAVVLPMAALLYLAGLPDGGRNSLLAILLQVAIVIGSVVLFAIFLARGVERMNARRVRRWLESDEGEVWLKTMDEQERAEFLGRLDDKASIPPSSDAINAESSVDSPNPTR